MIRKYSIFLLFLLVLLTGACSTTEKISDGEQLYVGIKSTKYHRETAEAKDKTAVQAFNTAKEEVDAALAYAPNGSMFGSSSFTQPLKLRLRIYNRYAESESRFGRWMFKHFSEAPVLISTVAPETRSKVAGNTLRNYGFFRGNVDYRIVETKHPKKAKIAYDVTTGPLFCLDSVEYRSFGAGPDSIFAAHRQEQLLKRGMPFSTFTLNAEQERMGNLLRENG